MDLDDSVLRDGLRLLAQSQQAFKEEDSLVFY